MIEKYWNFNLGFPIKCFLLRTEYHLSEGAFLLYNLLGIEADSNEYELSYLK